MFLKLKYAGMHTHGKAPSCYTVTITQYGYVCLMSMSYINSKYF